MRSSVSALPPRLTQVDLENNEQAKPTGPLLTFTEFLRVNMRLAEDRVLSFVTVFSTGFGTKWIPGATFYYEPEVTFQTLLTQRYGSTSSSFHHHPRICLSFILLSLFSLSQSALDQWNIRLLHVFLLFQESQAPCEWRFL
jgi:hypothetical protein